MECYGRLALVDGPPRINYSASSPSIEEIVDAHSKRLYSIAFSILNNPADAEDAVQETFLRVVQHCASLNEIENMEAWLRQIIYNVATLILMRSFNMRSFN